MLDSSRAYDHELVAHLRAGLSIHAIARQMPLCRKTLRNRAYAIGLEDLARTNGQAARNAQRGPNSARKSAFVGAIVVRTNERPSNLFRTVRFARVEDRDVAVDPDHIVACLHEGGLTLPEIEDVTGFGPVEAVAAIRLHGHLRTLGMAA